MIDIAPSEVAFTAPPPVVTDDLLAPRLGSTSRVFEAAPPRSRVKTHLLAAALVVSVAVTTFAAVSALCSSIIEYAAPPAAVVAPVAAVAAADEPEPLAIAVAVPEEEAEAIVEPLPPPEHVVALPSGAATALTWDGAHDEFRVAPTLGANATSSKVYMLADPPRLVFDIDGAAPASSHTLASGERFFQRIRVGKQAKATRVVIDLTRAPKSFIDEDGAAILSF